MKNKLIYAIVGILFLVSMGCSSNYTPKPKAYLRIGLPEKSYQNLQIDVLPCTFEYPQYADVLSIPNVDDSTRKKAQTTIEFPSLNGTIYLTYGHLDSAQQLYAYVDSSYQMMFKIHEGMLTGIMERTYEDEEHHVYGVLYELKGARVASPYQFYVTDRESHFLRGALYFHTEPNNDSLAPAINFLKEDIEHLMSTLRWHDKMGSSKEELNKTDFKN